MTVPRRAPVSSKGSETTYVLWLEGAGCDGCTMAMLGAGAPQIEDLLLHRIRDLPPIELVHPVLALESGDRYRHHLERAAAASLGPFLLVVEGSVMDETLAGQGSFSRLGSEGDRPVTIARWIDRLARHAEAIIAIGSCATWGGVPAASGNPTGATGLEAHLGRDFRSAANLPIINVPGCAPSGDAFVETLVYTLLHLQQVVPLELDEEHRPAWLYNETAQPVPPFADYLPPEAYATEGRPEVRCPVPSQGWMRGIGGCAKVGGCCIGCTEPDFVDRYLAYAKLEVPGRDGES